MALRWTRLLSRYFRAHQSAVVYLDPRVETMMSPKSVSCIELGAQWHMGHIMNWPI